MKSFHELAAEVAMEKLKSNLAKEAKKAPCRSEDIAEEHGCSCNDGGECKCDTDADCCDCNATNEANEDVKVKSADKKPELVNVDGKLITRMVPTTKRQADKKDDVEEGKKPGLWANMHARRKAGKPKLKPGDKNYPKTLDIESKEESANLKLINRIKNSGVVKTGSMSKDAPVKKTNEGVKTFAEISKGMAGRYIKKAQVSTADAAKSTERGYADSRSPDRDIAKAGSNQAKKGVKTFINRNKGTSTAVNKLTGKAKVPAK